MEKRLHLSSPLNKNHKDEREDIIGRLPEEILVSIISELPLREAVKTSVLSRKWKGLWSSIPHLIFDGSQTKWDIKCSLILLKKKRIKFIKMVNSVLNCHKAPILDDFVVCFDLGRGFSLHIDRWINFAFSKEVKCLEIDLTPFIIRHNPKYYDFPVHFIRLPHGLRFLKSLSLKFVNVSDGIIEHFLSSCLLLEELVVHCSEHLLDLKVVGSTLSLNYLEIKSCCNLKIIEICSPNLVSFSYSGEEIRLQVQNLPCLVDLAIGAPYGHYINHAFGPFSSYFSQIKALTFDMHLHKENMDFLELTELTNLKHLIIKVSINEFDSLLGLSELIKLSPFLHKFTLELLWLGRTPPRKMKDDVECPHQNLKVVEIIGFAGLSADIELVKFFIVNAVILEKIVLDTHNPALLKRPKEFHKCECVSGARMRAEQLTTELSAGVEVVIL